MSDTELARSDGDAIAELLNSGLTQIGSLDNSALGHALHRAIDAEFDEEIGSHGSCI
ncbi:MAG: hypothetical protein V7603_2209 [Micromonosporaceae bacterium]